MKTNNLEQGYSCQINNVWIYKYSTFIFSAKRPDSTYSPLYYNKSTQTNPHIAICSVISHKILKIMHTSYEIYFLCFEANLLTNPLPILPIDFAFFLWLWSVYGTYDGSDHSIPCKIEAGQVLCQPTVIRGLKIKRVLDNTKQTQTQKHAFSLK